MFATQRYTQLAAALAAASIAVGLSACGAATPTYSPDYLAAATEAPAMEMPEATEAAMEAPGSSGVDQETVEDAPDEPSNELVAALPQDRLIIKNGDIELTVQNTDAAIDQVTQIAVDNGG